MGLTYIYRGNRFDIGKHVNPCISYIGVNRWAGRRLGRCLNAPKAAPITSCRTICSMTLGEASLGVRNGVSPRVPRRRDRLLFFQRRWLHRRTRCGPAAARRSRCSCCSCSARDAEMASASSSSSCSRFLACLSLGHRPVGCPFVGCRGLTALGAAVKLRPRC